jgi:hypothetical protein
MNHDFEKFLGDFDAQFCAILTQNFGDFDSKFWRF